jgi:hypothetical protein
MDEIEKKTRMYGGGGLNEALETRPLSVEETHHEHRATVATPCHDCGRMIAVGTTLISQRITVTQGHQSQNFAYALHATCYRVLGQVVRLVPTHAAHLFGVGRKSLKQMWVENEVSIQQRHPELAALLQRAFPLAKR